MIECEFSRLRRLLHLFYCRSVRGIVRSIYEIQICFYFLDGSFSCAALRLRRSRRTNCGPKRRTGIWSRVFFSAMSISTARTANRISRLRRIGSAKPPKEAFRKRSSITRIVWRRGADGKGSFFRLSVVPQSGGPEVQTRPLQLFASAGDGYFQQGRQGSPATVSGGCA